MSTAIERFQICMIKNIDNGNLLFSKPSNGKLYWHPFELKTGIKFKSYADMPALFSAKRSLSEICKAEKIPPGSLALIGVYISHVNEAANIEVLYFRDIEHMTERRDE